MLSTALEDGSVNAWGDVEFYWRAGKGEGTPSFEDLIVHGDDIGITVSDNEGDDECTVTAAVFILNLLEEYGKLVPDEWVDDHDAYDASCWFQIGMFKEVIYG